MPETETISLNTQLIEILTAHNIKVNDVIEEGWVMFPKRLDSEFRELRQPNIRADVVKFIEHPDSFIVQIDVLVELFDKRQLCESFAGFGADKPAAIENGLENFIHGFLHVLLCAFYSYEDTQITKERWEINRQQWNVFLGNYVNRGDFTAPPKNLIQVIENLIRKQKLAENVHWLNLFYGQHYKQQLSCEVLFDNKLWEVASDEVNKLAWEAKEDYYSYRHSLVLVNDNYYEPFVGSSFISTQVIIAIEAFKDYSEEEDDKILEHLIKDGVEERLAYKLIDFVPIAVARPTIERLGLELNDHYQRMDQNGNIVAQAKFSDEPIFVEAYNISKNKIGFLLDSSEHTALAWRSVEFKVINDALNKGANVKDSKPPSVFFMNGNLETTSERSKDGEQKSWWQFWK